MNEDVARRDASGGRFRAEAVPPSRRKPVSSRRPAAYAGIALTGFAMGIAEVVPGFSGGTVALVAGVYERLIAVLRQGVRSAALAAQGRWRDARLALAEVEWPFAVVLGAGMLLALFTTASTLQGLIEDHPTEVSAVFLGLVLGAVSVAARRLWAPRAWHGAVVAAAAVLTFFGLAFSPAADADPGLLVIFVSVTIAVCAWILPGVSGSFLLLIMGVYGAVIQALSERDPVVIGVVALGCLVGLAAFSTFLNWLLLRAHDVVIAALIGLMLGSVRVLWPWPADEGIGSPQLEAPPGAESLLAASFGLAAFAAVLILGLVVSAVERRRAPQQPSPG